MNQKEKPVVHYKAESGGYIVVGHRANVIPIDHPNASGLVTNNEWFISTSPVRFYDRMTGMFETANSQYVPDGEWKPELNSAEGSGPILIIVPASPESAPNE